MTMMMLDLPTPDAAASADTAFCDDESRWQAVLARDARADGAFVHGVTSTGIYCRPSCPARHPRRTNVRFFADPAGAAAAGFRACQRCRPDAVARDAAAVAAMLRLLEQAAGPVPLARLAAAAGYSPAHASRVFSRAMGVSPSQWGQGLRARRTQAALGGAERVTDAIYDAGWSGPSRFYAGAERLGMAPSAWRKGGEGVTIAWTVVPTSYGPMLVAATSRGVCRLSFNEGAAELAAHFPRATLSQGDAAFHALVAQVVAQVEAPGRRATAIPLDVAGTAFQEAVWQALRRIPAGETRSYAQIAAEVGHPRAVRATGSANGANPVAVLVPCHRVIRGDGSPGGYAYGLAIKHELLRRERGEA